MLQTNVFSSQFVSVYVKASTKYSFDQGSGFVLGDEVMMC